MTYTLLIAQNRYLPNFIYEQTEYDLWNVDWSEDQWQIINSQGIV